MTVGPSLRATLHRRIPRGSSVSPAVKLLARARLGGTRDGPGGRTTLRSVVPGRLVGPAAKTAVVHVLVKDAGRATDLWPVIPPLLRGGRQPESRQRPAGMKLG